MRKIYLIVLAVFVFMLAAAFDILPGTGVPEVLVVILTAFVIPGLVALVKMASEKWPAQLGWLNGKFWLSVITYVLAAGAVAAFVQWKTIPALPADPGEAVSLVVVYIQAFFGASTGLYNILIAPVHNRLVSNQ